MKVQEIFELLSQGEFSALSLGGSEEMGILRHEYIKIIPHLNLGVQILYERFNLNVHTLVIRQDATIDTYYLDKDYAITNDESTEPIKYIIDSVADPFNGHVLRVDSVQNPDGELLTLNDRTDGCTVINAQYNTLKFPTLVQDDEYTVTYLTKPEKISHVGLVPEEVEVNLPLPYIQPLLFFIASRVYADNDMMTSQSYLAKYELACNHIDLYGLTVNDNSDTNSFTLGGWI